MRKTKNWSSLSINGTDFGRAKLMDFSLEEGTWVTYTKATLTLQIYEEGDLSSLEGDYYKGLTKLKDNGKYLEDFSEDFSFSRGPDSTTYSYSLTLKFSAAAQLATNNGCYSGEVVLAMECAEEIIKGDAAARPAFALIDDEVKALYSDYGKGKKRLLRETIDSLNNICTFTEEFTAYNIEGSYSSIIRQDLSLNEDGIVNIRENGTLLGIPTKTPLEIQRVTPDPNEEIEEARDPAGRLVEMFNYYKLLWGCEGIDDLVLAKDGRLLLIQKGRVYDTFKGEVKYDITVTNDPNYKNLVRHEYTVTTEALNGQKGNLYQATEQGTLTGKTKGEIDTDTDEDGDISWEKVKEYWKGILGNNGFVVPEGGGTPRIKEILNGALVSPALVNNSTTWSPWKVQIGYRQVVSEAPQYRENDGVAKSLTFKENKNYSTQKHKVGNVINQPARKQLLQTRETASRLGINGQIEIIGKRHAELDDLLDLSKDKLNDAGEWPSSVKPQDIMTYLEGCSYSFSDDNDIKLNLSIGWK